MTDPTSLAEIVGQLAADDFYDRRYKLIFGAMLTLYDKGKAPDIIAVCEELNSHLDEAGGQAFVASLHEGTSVYIGQYAAIVSQKAVLRRMIGAAGRIAAIGYEDGSLEDSIERATLEFRSATAVHARSAFARAGFRAYSLAGESWRLVLSRVDVADREPKGLVTVYTDDPNEYVLCRNVGLFGGTNLKTLAKELSARLGEPETAWAKRLDYLAQRTMKEAQAASEAVSRQATPDRPTESKWIFRGRIRAGRTISMFGPGSAGKTTISDGLALSACTGTEVIPGWIPAGQFIVGLLDWDEGKEENEARLYAMCQAYGLSLKDYHYRRMARCLADCADDVGKWVVDNRIEFLIVSPVSRAIRQGIGDPAAPIHELYEVLREFGTSNLLIAHVVGSAIGSDRPAAREYGSVAQTNDARGSYSVYCQSEEPGKRVVVLTNTKPDAMSARMDPQAIRIEFDPPIPEQPGIYDAITFHRDDLQVQSNGRETEVVRLIRILREYGPLNEGEIAKFHGCKASYVRRLVQKARERGNGVVNEDGKYRLGLSVVPSDE
jgi:hypothetical protein